MDGCGKCNNSPRGSSTDALIEKIKCELKSDEDMINMRKLCIQASNKSRECIESNRTIDSKISDLECLIKKLQDELNELACASRPAHNCTQECEQEYECDIDPCKPLVKECSDETSVYPEEPIVCTQNYIEEDCQSKEITAGDRVDTNIMNNKDKITKSPSNRFPIILRDVGHVQKAEDMSEKILDSDKIPKTNLKENVGDSENDVLQWKNYKNEPEKEEDKPVADTDSITVMIAELRAEISETIHTLNKDSNGPSNSQ